MKLVVLCDFDGTITVRDTAELVLSRFAEGDWRALDRQFEEGKLTLEQCLQKEFSMVKASEQEILDELRDVEFRSSFEDFAEDCQKREIPLIIVSAGLDFVIRHFLKLKGWDRLVETYIPKTKVTSDGILFVFPERFDKTTANFKQDFVRRCKTQGKRIVFIGDGSGDFEAAKEADLIFSVKGSRLAQLCKMSKVLSRDIVDFKQATNLLLKEFSGVAS